MISYRGIANFVVLWSGPWRKAADCRRRSSLSRSKVATTRSEDIRQEHEGSSAQGACHPTGETMVQSWTTYWDCYVEHFQSLDDELESVLQHIQVGYRTPSPHVHVLISDIVRR